MPSLSLSAIPAKIRAVFYSLPLFIGWIVPLTWENDSRLIRVGRRALALLLIYVAGIMATYLLSGLIQLFIANPGYVVALLFFILRTIFGLGYVIASLWLAYTEYRGAILEEENVSARSVLDLLDRVANRFEELVSR